MSQSLCEESTQSLEATHTISPSDEKVSNVARCKGSQGALAMQALLPNANKACQQLRHVHGMVTDTKQCGQEYQ